MIEKIVLLFGIIIVGYVGSLAIGLVWTVSDQIVATSNNDKLENSYETSKNIINVSEDVSDQFEFAKSIFLLAGIIGIPTVFIKKLFENL